MVFRKPYAFLIKNFRKIHIAMLILSVYIYLKVNGILEFVSEFVDFGTYNSSIEPFSSKTGVIFYLAILFIVVISVFLIVLLKRKNKPWKIYIVYIVEYGLMLFGILSINNYFNNFTNVTTVSGVMIYRDLVSLLKYIQFVVFILLGIRILGVDIKRFEFNKDEEFMELSEDDREEFEVSFEFDKNSITRKFNLIKRNIIYFYKEHRFICNVFIAGVTLIVVGYTYYYIAILHRSYRQNQTFKAGSYEITVLDSYITDKNLTGKVIEKDSNFVIIKIRLKNISNKELKPNLDRYHLMNANTDKIYNTYYNNDFVDFGVGADSKMILAPSNEKEFYMVYRVSNKLNKNRFVFYYQEIGGKLGTYLRKIKLKLIDVSEINKEKEYSLNKKIKFQYLSGDDVVVTATDYSINDTFVYNRYYCISDSSCSVFEEELEDIAGSRYIKLSFASSDFEGEDFIDFSERYGKIKYINNKGKTAYYDIVNGVKVNYEGKEIFIKVSDLVADSKELSIIYTLRNNKYNLKLR